MGGEVKGSLISTIPAAHNFHLFRVGIFPCLTGWERSLTGGDRAAKDGIGDKSTQGELQAGPFRIQAFPYAGRRKCKKGTNFIFDPGITKGRDVTNRDRADLMREAQAINGSHKVISKTCRCRAGML